jgi:CspA family cold shock protein
MPELTRRRSTDAREECWHIYYGNIQANTIAIALKQENELGAGKLKMWNADRGFGFIVDDAGGPDMFLHINELKTAGIDPDRIRVGDRLTFEANDMRDGKTKTSNVRIA